MAYVIDSPVHVYWVNDDELGAYEAAGWVQATPEQVLGWAQGDSFQGQHGAPNAPPLEQPAQARASRKRS